MGEDLEFTEEEMFFAQDRGTDENRQGQENLKGWANSTPKANNEKLKRQRSSLPEIGETSEFSSPEDAQNSENTGLQIPPSGGIQTRSKGHVSQSMTINRGREMASRHQKHEDEDDDDKYISKLGTSMPITIPGMEKPKAQKPPAHRPEIAQNDDFVPPHLLDPENMDSRAHSVNSGSLAKRDRLLQRNKILRRTGFLEGAAFEKEGKAGSGALPELMDPLNRRLMPISESHVGESALSAALGTPRKDALSRGL